MFLNLALCVTRIHVWPRAVVEYECRVYETMSGGKFEDSREIYTTMLRERFPPYNLLLGDFLMSDAFCPKEQKLQQIKTLWQGTSNKVSLQQDNLWIFVSLVYQIWTSPDWRIQNVREYSCCHGNKVSLATTSFMSFYCPNEQMYQIWTSSNFRMQSYW